MATDEGFSLAELMVVLLIIAVLLLIAVAAYVPTTRAASAAACRHDQVVLEKACTVAAGEAATSPAQLSDLSQYVSDFDDISTCPEDGATLTFDPVTGDVSCPNHP